MWTLKCPLDLGDPHGVHTTHCSGNRSCGNSFHCTGFLLRGRLSCRRLHISLLHPSLASWRLWPRSSLTEHKAYTLILGGLGRGPIAGSAVVWLSGGSFIHSFIQPSNSLLCTIHWIKLWTSQFTTLGLSLLLFSILKAPVALTGFLVGRDELVLCI